MCILLRTKMSLPSRSKITKTLLRLSTKIIRMAMNSMVARVAPVAKDLPLMEITKVRAEAPNPTGGYTNQG
jgi:hypothetical protein